MFFCCLPAFWENQAYSRPRPPLFLGKSKTTTPAPFFTASKKTTPITTHPVAAASRRQTKKRKVETPILPQGKRPQRKKKTGFAIAAGRVGVAIFLPVFAKPGWFPILFPHQKRPFPFGDAQQNAFNISGALPLNRRAPLRPAAKELSREASAV